MGLWRSGLRGWWKWVSDSAQANPWFSRISRGWQGLISKATDLEPELLGKLLLLMTVAGIIAMQFSFFFEFLLGMASGIATIAAWVWLMQRRGSRRSSVAYTLQLLGGRFRPQGYETVRWLNKVLASAWPYLARAMEIGRPTSRDWIEPYLEEFRLGMYQVIREQAELQRIEKYMPREEVIFAIYVNDMSLGTVPPNIEGVKIHDMKDGKIVLHVRIGWKSDAQIALGVGTTETDIVPMTLKNINMLITVSLTLRIMSRPPFIEVVVATVLAKRKPNVNFKLSVGETSEHVFPKVTEQLQDFLSKTILDSFVWPHRFVLPISPSKGTDLTVLELRLQGQLSVSILKGENLINLYPYVILYCRSKVKLRTQSIENTRDPVWNEEFILDVQDQDTQSLVLQVMNENKGTDEFVGVVKYPLKQLVSLDRDVELKLDVKPRRESKHGEGKSYGTVSVELRYHVYTDAERDAAMNAEQTLQQALETPETVESFTIAKDLIHPF